jgi:hypothetical protein
MKVFLIICFVAFIVTALAVNQQEFEAAFSSACKLFYENNKRLRISISNETFDLSEQASAVCDHINPEP